MQFLSLTLSVLSLGLLTSAGHNQHLNRQNHHDVAKRMPGTVELNKRFTGSKWTWYDAQTGNAGACGRHISNSDWAVALNTPQYGGGYPGPNCFKTITLRYNGKTAQAVILDQCPGCPWGGLDLTPALFEYFAPHGAGIIYGEWDFGEAAPPAPTTTWTPPAPTTTWTPPAPTTTWTPPAPTTTWSPPPTTTWTPPPPSTTSTSTRPTTTSSSSSSTHSSTHSSSSTSASHSSQASGTTSAAGFRSSAAAGTVLSKLNEAVVDIGNLVVQGAAAN